MGRVGVAADQEQVVGAGLGHPGQDRVEMGAVAHHSGGDVNGDLVAQLAQLGRHLDGTVGPVLGRAGDGQAHLLWQLCGLPEAAREGQHLEADRRLRGP